MRHDLPRRVLALSLALALTGSACVSTKLPPISAEGAAFQPLNSEMQLWEQARQEEAKFRKNARLYNDPLLEDYLEQVVGALDTPGMAANESLRYSVTVVEDPTLNAFAFPHGALYVHTGLLARMESESELATVLGHEMTHVENRHMLRQQRSARNKRIGWSVGAVAAAVVLAGEEAEAYDEGKWGKGARIGVLGDLMIGLGLQLAFIASVNGYGRSLEHEADVGGFEKMAAAGYNLDAAPEVYRALLDNHGESGKMEVFFFGSHPQLQERIENAEAWPVDNPDYEAETSPAGRRPDPGTFAKRMRPVVRDDARLNMEQGRFQLAASQLDRVRDAMPDDPETHLLIGILETKRSEQIQDDVERDGARARAADAFRESIRLAPDRPEAHRELGLLAYADNDFETACVQFRHYVELERTADDRTRIADYVMELEREGHCPS